MQFDRDTEINAKGQVNARPVTEVNSTIFFCKKILFKKSDESHFASRDCERFAGDNWIYNFSEAAFRAINKIHCVNL